VSEPLLDVRNLRVRFPTPSGPVEVVRGVSFTLGRERLGIVGESGSGKSTLGRIAVGLIPPTSGTVTVAGERLDNLDASASLVPVTA
jgi:peptide/nickel transport system ATP-binding protein